MGLTREIAEFVSNLDYAQIPADAASLARRGFTDYIGVMAAGWNAPVTRIVRSHSGVEADSRFSVASREFASAAMIYGTAAHALELDDVAMGVHISAVLASAILAEAAAVDTDGVRLLAAYVAGYEVWAELLSRERGVLHDKGWHPTATFGVVGAACACSVLRGLTTVQCQNAIGLACSLASGMIANFGTMAKPFQVGNAAQSGVHAARLAQAGMTAASEILEHPRGFLYALSPHGVIDLERPVALGRKWAILEHGLNIKFYPVCYLMHRSIDGMLALRRDHGLAPESIERVTVRTGQQAGNLLSNYRPKSAHEARFSLPFVAAAAFVAGGVALGQLTDSVVLSPAIVAFLERVVIETTSDLHPVEAGFAPFEQVRLDLADGRCIVGDEIEYPRGHFRNRADVADLRGKFITCTSSVMPARAAQNLFELLENLEGTTIREINASMS